MNLIACRGDVALKPIHLLVATLFLVALSVRLAFVTRHSLWVDEAFTVSWCSESLPKMLKRIAGEDRHPPLYCLLSYPIMRISNCTSCPFDQASKCEASVRLVSVISGAALIFVAALIGMHIGGVTCALLSACLLIIHPGAIHFSHEARPYMLHTFLSTLASLLWIGNLKRADWESRTENRRGNMRPSRLTAFCIVSSLSLYSCYMAFMPWLARVLCVGIQLKRRKDATSLHLLAADIIAMGTLLPWLVFVLSQPNVMGTEISPSKIGIGVSVAFLMNDFAGYEYGLSQSSTPTLLLALVVSIACAITLVGTAHAALRNIARCNGQQSNDALMLMIAWSATHFGLLLIAPLLISEFNRWQRIFDGIVPLSLLLAYSAAHAHPAASSLRQRLITANARLTIAIMLGLHCIGTYNYLDDSRYFREDWRGAAQFAMAHENEFDFIVLNAPCGSFPFKLYYSGRKRFEDAPSLVTDVEQKAAEAWLQMLLNEHRRILVIECRLWQVDPTGWLNAQLQRRAKQLLRWCSSKISATVWEVRELK